MKLNHLSILALLISLNLYGNSANLITNTSDSKNLINSNSQTTKILSQQNNHQNIKLPSNDICGLRQAVKLKFNINPLILLMLTLIIIAIVLTFCFFIKNKTFFLKKKSKLHPYRAALKGLTECLNNIKNTDTQKFTEKLTDIVLDYLSYSFNFRAKTSTTDELLIFFSNQKETHNELREEIVKFFQQSDLIKFTQLKFDENCKLKLHKKAEIIIETIHKFKQELNEVKDLNK